MMEERYGWAVWKFASNYSHEGQGFDHSACQDMAVGLVLGLCATLLVTPRRVTHQLGIIIGIAGLS